MTYILLIRIKPLYDMKYQIKINKLLIYMHILRILIILKI